MAIYPAFLGRYPLGVVRSIYQGVAGPGPNGVTTTAVDADDRQIVYTHWNGGFMETWAYPLPMKAEHYFNWTKFDWAEP